MRKIMNASGFFVLLVGCGPAQEASSDVSADASHTSEDAEPEGVVPAPDAGVPGTDVGADASGMPMGVTDTGVPEAADADAGMDAGTVVADGGMGVQALMCERYCDARFRCEGGHDESDTPQACHQRVCGAERPIGFRKEIIEALLACMSVQECSVESGPEKFCRRQVSDDLCRERMDIAAREVCAVSMECMPSLFESFEECARYGESHFGSFLGCITQEALGLFMMCIGQAECDPDFKFAGGCFYEAGLPL